MHYLFARCAIFEDMINIWFEPRCTSNNQKLILAITFLAHPTILNLKEISSSPFGKQTFKQALVAPNTSILCS
jgi:hypothetical protein